jgi:hypothetical protein
MKKIIIILGLLGFLGGVIWLCGEDPNPAISQYGSENLKNIYSWSSGYKVLDGANATTTFVFLHKISDSYGGFGSAWGSYTVWVTVEDLKAGTQADSMQIWHKEIKSYTSSSDYVVSTWDSTLIGTYDWTTTSNQWKKYTMVSDVCLGQEFRVKNTTTVDDCVKVKIDVIYQ